MSYSARRSGFNLVSTLSPSVLCQWSGRAASAKHISSHPSIHCFSRTRNARQALRSIPKHPYASLLARTASTATYITKPAKPIAPPVARPPPSLSKPVNSSPSAPSKPSPAASTPTAAAFPPQTDLSDPKTQKSLTNGLYDDPETLDTEENKVDWSRSFHGLSQTPFSKEAADVLLQPVAADDIEIKPDGIVYLPEIKYRRILNRAFGPGAWGLAPRGETIVTPKTVTREYGLVVHGRLVSIARGEQQYFDAEGIPTATEGCKSNALMRCCKDLGIASELWDPVFIRRFMREHSRQIWVEHATTKKRKLIVMRKDVPGVPYPWKEARNSA